MPLCWAGCKSCWGEPVEARVWAFRVVVDPPCVDDPTCRGQAGEYMLVEALVAEAAVEALHEPVLLRLARRDVLPGHAAVLLPAQDRMRRQLGAVVTDDHRRIAPQPDDPVQLTADPRAGERGGHHQGK